MTIEEETCFPLSTPATPAPKLGVCALKVGWLPVTGIERPVCSIRCPAVVTEVFFSNKRLPAGGGGKRRPEVPQQCIETHLCVWYCKVRFRTQQGPVQSRLTWVGEGLRRRMRRWVWVRKARGHHTAEPHGMDGGVGAAGQRKRVVGLSSATSSLGRRRQHWTHCEPPPSLRPLHPPLPLTSQYCPIYPQPRPNTASFFFFFFSFFLTEPIGQQPRSESTHSASDSVTTCRQVEVQYITWSGWQVTVDNPEWAYSIHPTTFCHVSMTNFSTSATCFCLT